MSHRCTLDGMSHMELAFRPPEDAWVAVSPKLITVRRLILGLWCAGLLLAAAVLAVAGAPTWIVGILVLLAGLFLVVGWPWIGRRVRSWGYAEREDDLLVASGILFRRLVVVPYGRMQFVDVKAGPIDRGFGLTTVQLHTAAAASDATIPGLPPEVAAGLRDRLATRGEQRSAGL